MRSAVVSHWLIAAALLAAALLTRFYGLGDWPIYRDEKFTILYAAERAGSLTNPAYYHLVLASLGLPLAPETAVRLPAAVLGTLAIPAMYLLWAPVLGRAGAALAAVLLLVSPWHLFHSQYARFYGGVVLFTILSTAAFFTAMRGGSVPRLALALALALGAVLFHATAVTVLAGFYAWALYVLFTGGGRRAAERKLAKLIVIGGVVPGAALAVVLAPIAGDWLAARQGWQVNPLRFAGRLAFDLELVLGAAALLGVLRSLWLKQELGAFLLVMLAATAGLPLAATAVFDMRTDYAIAALPLACIAATQMFFAAGAERAPGGFPTRFAVPVLLIVPLLPPFFSHYLERHTLDAREAVAYVEARREAGDRVYTYSTAYDYYVDAGAALLPYIGHPVLHAGRWEPCLNRYLNSADRIWLMLRRTGDDLAPDLEHWLTTHAALKWRQYAVRYDRRVEGFEVYLAERPGAPLAPDQCAVEQAAAESAE